MIGNLLFGEKNILKNRELIALPNVITDSMLGEMATGKLDTVNDTVNDTVKNNTKVLNLIKANPKITRKALAEATVLSESTIARTIRKLRDAGILRRVGSDKAGHWEVEEYQKSPHTASS